MRKLLIFIFLLIFCNTAYADNSHFAFGLSEEEGIKLLTGEKSISLAWQSYPDENPITAKLKKEVFSDIKLKFRLIGLEPSDLKPGVSILVLDLAVIPTINNLYLGNKYSGNIGLSFRMIAESRKGGAPFFAAVWEYAETFANVGEQEIRNSFKYMMDKFLIVYLKANPRKFIDDTPDKKNQ